MIPVTKYREKATIDSILNKIEDKASRLEKPLKIMEVCGTHTAAIGRWGLRQLLPDNILLRLNFSRS